MAVDSGVARIDGSLIVRFCADVHRDVALNERRLTQTAAKDDIANGIALTGSRTDSTTRQRNLCIAGNSTLSITAAIYAL